MKTNYTYLLLILIFGIFSCQRKTENDDINSKPIKKIIPQVSEIDISEINDLKIKTLTKAEIPTDISYEGEIKNAVRWKDKMGDNIVLTTETGIYQSDKFQHENEGGDAELFAYHYTIHEGRSNLVWKVYDYISDCPVDIEAKFIKDTFNITDLDENGIAEIWIMYTTVCHGDVSPANMKIIMYEVFTKHAMRGRNRITLGPNEDGSTFIEGGEYVFDDRFLNSRKEFQEYAINLWNSNIDYNWN